MIQNNLDLLVWGRQREMMNVESYKRLEISIILLSIAVLAALFMVHIAFLFEIGYPSKLLLLTLAIRFVILIFELHWLQSIDEHVNQKLLKLHTHLSIWVNIIFAFIASVFSGTPDSHYSVLMIIPIVQAAYRFNLLKTVGIVAVTIVLTFLEVWIFFQQKPPVDYGEFFEAATVSLVFFVVGSVVWLLAGYLRDEVTKLKEGLAALKEMQEKLISEEKLAAVGPVFKELLFPTVNVVNVDAILPGDLRNRHVLFQSIPQNNHLLLRSISLPISHARISLESTYSIFKNSVYI